MKLEMSYFEAERIDITYTQYAEMREVMTGWFDATRGPRGCPFYRLLQGENVKATHVANYARQTIDIIVSEPILKRDKPRLELIIKVAEMCEARATCDSNMSRAIRHAVQDGLTRHDIQRIYDRLIAEHVK